VQVIEACRSLTQAAELLKLDWDSVMLIMARAVKRMQSDAALKKVPSFSGCKGPRPRANAR
jgi:hypothetical protein